jgi:hypothetical protein
MLDTATGEVVEVTLKHEGDNVREFYSSLPRPVRVGIEATGSMQWFLNLMEELGIECLVGHPAQIRAAAPRKQKNDRRDAELILKMLVEGRFPAIRLPSKELQDLRSLLRHRHQWIRLRTRIQNAVDCPGEWSTTRPLPVEPSRPPHDRVIAVGAPYRLSAERVASDVREVRSGDRETKPASRGASLQTSRSAAAADPSRSGADHSVSDRGVSRRSRPIRRQQGPG